MHVQTVEATDWWARPRGGEGSAWIANYQRSLKVRHRDVLVELVQALAPDSVLEVGCHCGPNLIRLAKACPDLHLAGIDVNVEAVTAGRQWAHTEGVSARVQLNAGRFPEMTSAIATGAFDVVLSCYALAYIAPADLDAALFEMGRLARRAVIFAEPMALGTDAQRETRSLSGYTEWAHHYEQAMRWVASLHGMQTRIVPIVPPVDRLNAVLVCAREATTASNTP